MYAVNEEAVINKSAPVLVAALDELELLADQLRASDRPDETLTVLLEPVGPPSAVAISAFAQSLPRLMPLELGEVTPGNWAAVGTAPCQRMAFVFHGPGVRSQLEPWLGYARVEVEEKDGTMRRALVRSVGLEGGDESLHAAREVLTRWDEQMKADREARRNGATLADEPWPRIVFERDATGAAGRFVSTGLEGSESFKHLAACLRARSAAS